MTPTVAPVGSFTTQWGESVTWDERRGRLWFVDCMASTLHWLDDGETAPGTMAMPSMPTGVVLATDGRLVVVLDDGLHAVDADAGTTERLSAFPPELGGRCNDACADLDGNVITGKLNLGPDEGSAWRWSPASDEWTLLDDDIANTNGPNVGLIEGVPTQIIGDTSAQYWAYPYDGVQAGERRLFGDVDGTGGRPDGATIDADGALWAALVGGGVVARYGADSTAPAGTIDVGFPNPTDVAFGGPGLDRLFVTVIDGPLLVVDGLGATGRPEPRAALA